MSDEATGEVPRVTAEFIAQRSDIRENMGGAAKVARIHAAGGTTARDRIDRLVDPNSFWELGTFVRSATPSDREDTPGDGLIGGYAELSGRPLVVAADDVTVRRASSAESNLARLHRLMAASLRQEVPFVYLGERGGGRVPDVVGAESFMRIVVPDTIAPQWGRARRVPTICGILGQSFGGSSVLAASSDFTIQLEGSVMALTSDRVNFAATGSTVSGEQLGGAQLNYRSLGRVDAVASTEAEMYELIAKVLSILPSSANERAPLGPRRKNLCAPNLRSLVPTDQRKTYDMHVVLREIFDASGYVEIRGGVGRSAICALGRIDGISTAIIASNPGDSVGVLTPAAASKMIRTMCLAEAFNLPVIFLIDTPGFLVGPEAEAGGLLQAATNLMQASTLLSTPTLSLMMRKAYGLGFGAMAASPHTSEAVLAWPTAEIGFMGPVPAANVIYHRKLAEIANPRDRQERLTEYAKVVAQGSSPYGPAAVMNIDEIIEPAETVAVFSRLLHREIRKQPLPFEKRPLMQWPLA